MPDQDHPDHANTAWKQTSDEAMRARERSGEYMRKGFTRAAFAGSLPISLSPAVGDSGTTSPRRLRERNCSHAFATNGSMRRQLVRLLRVGASCGMRYGHLSGWQSGVGLCTSRGGKRESAYLAAPEFRWSANAAPTQLSVYNVNMRPAPQSRISQPHSDLIGVGYSTTTSRRDSVSPICRGPDKTLKGKLSTAKPKAHRQDENASPPEQEALKANRRSRGQRARRQRELATQIIALNVHGELDCGSIRSRGRRKLEAAKRCLEDDPNCDSTNALSKAINRMQAIAKEIDLERREREENTL
ncbi:hypothetical protein B0H13DRAFT_2293155 [Mycena leptocephala]|nr:hypothetical protein B0H13DRAFT_2293155 [Mycena leptocephala]